jgi:Lon protease-like protein
MQATLRMLAIRAISCVVTRCELAFPLAVRRPPVRGEGQAHPACPININLFLPVSGRRAKGRGLLMTTPQGPRKRLPNNPSEENLRKQAKQLAKDEGLQLAAAQRRLATEYGYKNWAELMRSVSSPFVPLVPLRGLVAFPHEVYPIYVGRQKSVSAIDAVAAGSAILLVAQRDATIVDPSPTDMYGVGTLAVIVERQRVSDGTAKIMVEGRRRARVIRFAFDQTFLKAEVEEIKETADRSGRSPALISSVFYAVPRYAIRKKRVIPWVADGMELENPSIVSYRIARHLDIQLEEQQGLLETPNPIERLEKILGYLKAVN